jgi:hypothetical protein
MENNIYKELFTLVHHEGERLVVINPETDEGLVVIKLSEYKRLRDTEQTDHLPQVDKDDPILAKNIEKNLSFWEHTKEETEPIAIQLDNPANSGKIHERKSAKSSKTSTKVHIQDEPQLVEDETSAGEEYYFEPAEEIGL